MYNMYMYMDCVYYYILCAFCIWQIFCAKSIYHFGKLAVHVFILYVQCTCTYITDNSLQVAEFNPDLSSYFAEVCASSSSFSSQSTLPPSLDPVHSGSARGRSFGVPFQEATDNSRNFPSMKAFHAFKKQRYFYFAVFLKGCMLSNFCIQLA